MWNHVESSGPLLQAIKVLKIGNRANVSHLFAGLVRGIFDAPRTSKNLALHNEQVQRFTRSNPLTILGVSDQLALRKATHVCTRCIHAQCIHT